MSKSPLSMPRPGRLTSIQGDQRHSSWQPDVVTVEAEVDVVKLGPVAGVFTDNMLLVVDATLLGDPGYTTLGVGLECVLEGRIEVMTVDKSNRSKHWGLGAVCPVPSHSLAPHSSAALRVSPPWSYQL